MAYHNHSTSRISLFHNVSSDEPRPVTVESRSSHAAEVVGIHLSDQTFSDRGMTSMSYHSPHNTQRSIWKVIRICWLPILLLVSRVWKVERIDKLAPVGASALHSALITARSSGVRCCSIPRIASLSSASLIGA
jgi:hypothetical protein